MRIERVAIDSLRPDPANARRHGERNLESIKASLTRFGQQKPIVVATDGTVVAGNGTLEAAQALGWDHINVIRTRLDGSEAAAFAVADNRTGELAEWDTTALASMLEADRLVPGFTADEIDELVNRARIDADLAHFEGLAADPPGNGETGDASPTGGTPRPEELSLVITGPRADIDRIRERIGEVRQDRPDLTMAAALLELMDGEPPKARKPRDRHFHPADTTDTDETSGLRAITGFCRRTGVGDASIGYDRLVSRSR